MGDKVNTAPLIRLQDLNLDLKSGAGTVNILRRINLDIISGTTVGIVGASGAGKTSLMMVIAGLEAATSGTINILNKDFSDLDEDQLALFRRDNIGIVFQAFRLIPTMTAIENIALPLEMIRDPEAYTKARHALTQIGLTEREEHYPDQLSGGEQQRVAIARAFIGNPKILLADEPTGNLDEPTGKTAIDLLFKLQAQHGTTLLLITHDQKLASRCSRIVTLANGTVTRDEEPPSTDNFW